MQWLVTRVRALRGKQAVRRGRDLLLKTPSTHFTEKWIQNRAFSAPKLPPEPKWLQQLDHPKLHQFLEMEEDYLSKFLQKPRLRSLERHLYLEMRERLLQQDMQSIPERIGDYEYYSRQDVKDNFPVYYRRHVVSRTESVVFDQNSMTLPNDGYHLVTAMKISHDDQLLLVVLQDDDERCHLVMRNLQTGKLHPYKLDHEVLQNIRNVEWASSQDNRAPVFYFSQTDHQLRPFRIHRYDCASHSAMLVYEEANPSVFVDLSKTKDGRYVLINCNTKSSSEIWALDSNDQHARPKCIRTREEDTIYFAEHANDRFIFVTNADSASNYKIMTASNADETWKTLVSASDDVKIDDVDLFDTYLVLYERVHSLPRVRVITLTGSGEISKEHIVPLPSEHSVSHVFPGVNRDPRSHIVRFALSTPLIQEIVYDYNMETEELIELKRSFVPKSATSSDEKEVTSFVPHDYVCERLFVPSLDASIQVPMTLIHHKDLVLNSRNPTLVLGYGAYGTNLDVDFQLEHLSLLQRGWVIALAHVRGGGELGFKWYHAGRQLEKRNTFDDFVACTQYLIDAKYTQPRLVAGKGASAGGLIMGVMANEYPNLFQALIFKVPFLDILNTMMDPSLPLTLHEYEEWGDPNVPHVYDYIRSYGPIANMKPGQQYPSMLVTGSLNDPRVGYWEPLKWVYNVRKLQAQRQESPKNVVLLDMREEDGHFGGGGKLELLQDSAMEFTFLYHALRLPSPASS